MTLQDASLTHLSQIEEIGVLFGDKIAETFDEAENVVVRRRSIGSMEKTEVSMEEKAVGY